MHSKSEDLIPCFQLWSLLWDRWIFVGTAVFLTLPANGCTVAACKLLHFHYSFQCSFWGWPAQTWRPSPVLRMGNFRCEPEMEPTEAISTGQWVLSIKGFSKKFSRLCKERCWTNQVPFNWSFSLAYVYVIHQMFFFAQGSLDKGEIGAVHMSIRSYYGAPIEL